MNLYDSIFRRKSCRTYDMQPLPQATLQDMEKAIEGFMPLYPGLSLRHRLVKKLKGHFLIEAPHYLVISGQGKSGEAENAGFLYEQLALWLDAKELGCVWLGASKDADGADEGDIIAMGLGQVTGSVHRTRDQFKRNPIETITNAPEDPCIQAVHLAPSGMNTQPWYLEKEEGRILVYEQKLRPPVSLLYKHSDLDMGIGLCHYALACKEQGKPFSFNRVENLPAKGGFRPFGIIETA